MSQMSSGTPSFMKIDRILSVEERCSKLNLDLNLNEKLNQVQPPERDKKRKSNLSISKSGTSIQIEMKVQDQDDSDSPITSEKDTLEMMTNGEQNLLETESASNNNLDQDSNSLIQAQGNRSIEIFFGSLKTFHTFYQMLCEKGVGPTSSPNSGDEASPRKTKVKPDSIKKLVLVGHPMTSFGGINLFVKLAEVWVTGCCIPEAKWSDFTGLIHLHKLFIYNCQINKIEPLHFQNLKVLWLAGNNLTSLSFLGQGLVCLTELNVARNDIYCLLEEHLFKCVNLQRLNLSGNPLCILQDVQAVKVLSSLHSLLLADPVYGKCPVATLCDSRSMLLSILTNVTSLDGKKVTPSEISSVQEYLNTRSLFYYATSVRGILSQVSLRKSVVSSTNKQMEAIGGRLLELVAVAAKYRRTISSVEIVPIFTNAKNLMKDQLMKIENRMLKLKEWKEVTTKRLEMIMQISRWEQEAEKWMKWMEYKTFGNTQSRVSHSIHGSTIADGGSLCHSMHELLSALACSGLWPPSMMLKVETIMTVRDKGMEAGMERVFYDNFALKDEPKFVPPAPDSAEADKDKKLNLFSGGTYVPMMSPTNPYCPPPVAVKTVMSYTTPDYKPPPPIYPFPESVPGLPERAQPLFMFLVCPQNFGSNPLLYLQRVLLDKSRQFKEIRVTNCLWLACQNIQPKPMDSTYNVVLIVKVLEECLQPISMDKRGCSLIMRHAWDCSTFSVKRPLAFAPAYVVNISFTHENKQAIWHKGTIDDDDVMVPAETALSSLLSKIQAHGHPPVAKPGRSKTQPHIKRIGDGFHADLSAVHVNVTKDGHYEIKDSIRQDKTHSNAFDLHHVGKLLGKDASQVLTSLDLSGNRLGLTVGLDNVATLKKLNLSYNNLTTLSGLQRLPNLIELKVGWNSLRFLHSNITTLAWVSPRLLTLEILPNPFQDVRDLAHIPVLFHRSLPLLNRVDVWTAPFSPPNTLIPFAPPETTDACFGQMALGQYWGGNARRYNELSSKCLTHLEQLPVTPPGCDAVVDLRIDLNVSDNYLTSIALQNAVFCSASEWRQAIVSLQLQENMITTLDWLVGVIFPNCQILNLSINQLEEVDNLPSAFPNLKHLHLSGNPLQCEITVLATFRSFSHLLTLDCSSTPVASHPDYAPYIVKNMSHLKILDGTPIPEWELTDSTERLGGTVTPDWLEDKIGHRDWGSLSQLSLANSGVCKMAMPPHALPKLLSLDLQDNGLTSFACLSSLPSLRVLCVSHNNISSLGGNPCPVCYAHTAQSQAANAHKLKTTKHGSSSTYYEWNGKTQSGLSTSIPSNKGTGFDSFGMPLAQVGAKHLPCHTRSDLRNTGATAWGFNTTDTEKTEYSSPPTTPLVPPSRKICSKPVFPRLEVLIMAHNGLSSMGDLHLHSMQNLQTIILNCNSLTSLQGLENLPTVRAIVLDHNRIRDIPFNSLAGCKSLRYLHLEHNRIANLPRLPHLTNLCALYMAYNKIQSLTDLNALSGASITELSMAGNPLAIRSDYRLNVAARLPQLTTLDGKDLAGERYKLGELTNRWFPGSSSTSTSGISKEGNFGSGSTEAFFHREQQQSYNPHGHYQNHKNSSSAATPGGGTNGTSIENSKEFSLRVKPLNTPMSNTYPRSLQYSSHKQKNRYASSHHEH